MKELQQFLNYYVNERQDLKVELVVDGIIGSHTKKTITLAKDLLKSHVKDSGLKWNDNFMFIGIRTDQDLDNTFDDWFVIIEKDKMLAFPASTVSGVPGIKKYWYRMINGKRGVGTVKAPQQIKYTLIQPGGSQWHNWTGGIGFLYQSYPIVVHRGAYLKEGIWLYDEKSIVPNTLGGFNVHSWLNWFSSLVNNLSEGCQVVKYNYWKILYPILKNNMTKNSVIEYTLIKMF